MNQQWKEVSSDILNMILEYDGRIVKRNGIYMNRIHKQDERYEIIKNIPQKKYYKMTYIEQCETFVYFKNKKFFIGFIETPQSIKFHFFSGSMSWKTYLLN